MSASQARRRLQLHGVTFALPAALQVRAPPLLGEEALQLGLHPRAVVGEGGGAVEPRVVGAQGEEQPRAHHQLQRVAAGHQRHLAGHVVVDHLGHVRRGVGGALGGAAPRQRRPEGVAHVVVHARRGPGGLGALGAGETRATCEEQRDEGRATHRTTIASTRDQVERELTLSRAAGEF